MKAKQGSRKDWKSNYFVKLNGLLKEYPKAFIVKVDNVGSSQMQQIRHSLRGHAVIIMGKNTMMRKTITDMREEYPDLEKLVPHIRGNVGFVLTKGDLSETREKLLGNRVAAPAKAGAIAPCDVKIPAQNTGLPPEKTSFFQALSIPTKINRGTIEILTDVSLIREGQKVGASEATLLGMLKIMPFSYGLVVDQVFDSGAVFAPAVLDITQEHLLERISEGVANVAAVALAIGQPTLVSATHAFLDGFRNLVALSLETDYSFPAAEKLKEAIASGATTAAAAPPKAEAKAAKQEKPKEEAKKPEPKKEEPKPAEEEDDMGLSLFD